MAHTIEDLREITHAVKRRLNENVDNHVYNETLCSIFRQEISRHLGEWHSDIYKLFPMYVRANAIHHAGAIELYHPFSIWWELDYSGLIGRIRFINWMIEELYLYRSIADMVNKMYN